MDGVTPYIRSILLIPTMLVAYCMCNCVSTTVGMEGLSANYIRGMERIASGDAAVCLDQSESSFIRSAISNCDSFITYRDLQHVKCGRWVLSKTVLRSRLNAFGWHRCWTNSQRRIIRWFFQLSKIIAAVTT